VEAARAPGPQCRADRAAKGYIEKACCAQIRSDKQLLRSRIAQMHPSVQRAFLQARLEKQREKGREIRTPVSDE
jgi:hypothetical protein